METKRKRRSWRQVGEKKAKKKEGRQISGKETPGAFLGISVF